jgi:TonB family protein
MRYLIRYSLLLPLLLSVSILCFAQEINNSIVISAKSVLSLSAVQDEKKWHRYTAGGEEFSVLMPGRPFVHTFDRPEQRDYTLFSYVNRKEMRMYGSYDDGTVCIVMSSDNPNGKEPLDIFIDEFPQYPVFHNEMSFEQDITHKGFKGKQYRVKSSHVSGIVQFYQTKNHIYIFEVVSDNITKPSIKQFLSKLTLDGKTKGEDIVKAYKETYLTNLPASPPPTVNGATSQTPTQKETFSPKEVTRKAIIIVRAEPQYTEEARKNAISGTVVIRAVLSASGEVTNIRAVDGLPYGLTEKAIAGARLLKFIPAVKEGRYVSQYIQIEYNFNLY